MDSRGAPGEGPTGEIGGGLFFVHLFRIHLGIRKAGKRKMIHVVAVGEVGADLLQKLGARLYQIFGVGCELGPDMSLPVSMRGKGGKSGVDGIELLEKVHSTRHLPRSKDITIYITTKALKSVKLPTGVQEQPQSLSLPEKGCGLVSLSGLTSGKAGGNAAAQLTARASRLAVHEVGHLLGLRHCVEAKCAMYPPWTPAFAASETVQLCAFCQDKCEQKLEET